MGITLLFQRIVRYHFWIFHFYHVICRVGVNAFRLLNAPCLFASFLLHSSQFSVEVCALARLFPIDTKRLNIFENFVLSQLCQSLQFFHLFQNKITGNKFVQSQNIIPKTTKTIWNVIPRYLHDFVSHIFYTNLNAIDSMACVWCTTRYYFAQVMYIYMRSIFLALQCP